MQKSEKIKRIIGIIRPYVLYAMLATIVFSLLVPNSFCIMALVAIWLLEGNCFARWRILLRDRLFLAFLAYFILQLIGLFFSHDLYEGGWCYVENKLGFLALPVVFCSSTYMDKELRRRLMMCFAILLTVASLYCIAMTFIHYASTHNSELFFYHS